MLWNPNKAQIQRGTSEVRSFAPSLFFGFFLAVGRNSIYKLPTPTCYSPPRLPQSCCLSSDTYVSSFGFSSDTHRFTIVLVPLIINGFFDSSIDKTQVPVAHRLLTEDTFYVTIFDYCSARSLVLLLRTCRPVNNAVRMYMDKRFNINRILDRYFSDAMSFRFLQARTGTLISGSSALQYFDRSFYPTSDLDIYVSRVWAREVGQFLLQQGYQFCRDSSQHPTFNSALKEKRVANATAHYGNFKGIAAVFTFKKGQAKGEDLKVQVMASVRSPMEVILRFHSST